MKRRPISKKNMIWATVLIATPLILGVLALGMGRYTISLSEIVNAFFPGVFSNNEVEQTVKTVLFTIRTPRVILALIAGAGLSVAGASFQGLFSNPLATPDTLGVASGASFGAALGILLQLPTYGIQISAVIFGVCAVVIVYAVSQIKGSSSVIMIILSGMVVGALFNAFVSLVKYIADPQDTLPAIMFWLLGSLAGTNFEKLMLGSPALAIGIIVVYVLRWRLNVMSLHEDEAKSLGTNVKMIRISIIVASTMITASVISMCGAIGWVGLLIPHVARMIFGNDNQLVIPACMGLGATYLLVIDTIARSVSAAEIPVSILTAIVGAPVFIILLRKTGGVKV